MSYVVRLHLFVSIMNKLLYVCYSIIVIDEAKQEEVSNNRQIINDGNENEEKVTYVVLGGSNNQKRSVSSKHSAEQFVSFDFMVTLPKNLLESDDNLKRSISKSVDCDLNQLTELHITQMDDASNKSLSRVNGKIYTDDWELPMLQKKFQKIISDRVLSGHLQTICSLEDRPRIRRFFCKTSQELNLKNNLKLRMEQTDSVSSQLEENNISPSDAGTTSPQSTSIDHELRTEQRRNSKRKSSSEKDAYCQPSDDDDGCLNMCVVL